MNIKKLKEIIENLPENMDVFMDERITQDEFRYGLVNSGEVKNISFSEPENQSVSASDKCFILSEE